MGTTLPPGDESTGQKLVPLATAPNQIVAELWISALRDDGVSALMDARDAVSFLGVSNRPVRVLVQQARLAEATAILNDLPAGDDVEEPETTLGD